MYFLGVDGGGTKTAFCLVSEHFCKKFVTSTCYIDDVGEDGVHKVFQEFESFLKTHGLSYQDIKFATLGMPGFSESPKWDSTILKILDYYFGDKFQCENDCFVGWAGSLACQAGINIVAGTGAIGYAMNEKDETARISGWGHIIGDEGSGYWLGMRCMEVFSKQSDGRMKKTAIYDLFKHYIGLKEDGALIDLVYNQWKGSRTNIADLSKIAYQAALEGDSIALELINQTAYELALMAEGLMNKLSFEGKIFISYSGGIFKMGDLILNPIKQHLSKSPYLFELIAPILEPVEGAAFHAAKRYNNTLSPTDLFQ
ncbi:MAG: N-acetylglucosamine kinase [Brevinema sp.]